MKQIHTILCCCLFVLAGAMAIGMQDRTSPTGVALFPGNAQAFAQQTFPVYPTVHGLPLDVQLDLEKRTRVDTVYRDSVRVDTVYKTKIRKVAVPEVVEIHDTLSVPVFYIATPLEHKVESTEIIIIDDVHICDSTETNHTGISCEE